MRSRAITARLSARGLACAAMVLGAFAAAFAAEPVDAKKLPPAATRKIDFAADVQPIFAKHCVSCHGVEKQKSDYRLDQKKSALTGGSFGGAIVPGKSGQSKLIHNVAGLDEDMKMPPKGNGLSHEEIGILRAWIDQGADWPDSANGPGTSRTQPQLWSLKPLNKPAIPKVKNEAWVRTPIDAFILAKLEEKGLSPAPTADPRTLIRRVYFDLIGLPPTPEEVEAFVKACEREGTKGQRDEGTKGQGEEGTREATKALSGDGTEGMKAGPESRIPNPASRPAEPETRNQKPETPPHPTPCTLNPTPSRPRYQLLRLPTRVPGLTLPRVEIIDLTEERRKRYEITGKAGVHLLSLRLEAAIRRTWEAKAQTLLLLNRRGFANYIACPDHKCGWLMKCEFCDTTMVYHKQGDLPAGGYVECHHCTARQQLPAHCPICQKKVAPFGLGVQRVEEELTRKFQGIRVQRMDSDTMRTARDYAETLEHFQAGFIDVLVGTQMIAKGLDYPNVRLVGVISADTSLHMPDFRSSERTFQLIAQVAGRTGRGSDAGTVIVQTFSPGDPAIVLASKHDYDTFARQELEVRQQMGLPPVTRMARIVVRDKDHLKCYEQAKALAANLTKFNDQLALQVRLRGPTACALARVAEFHRLQIELIARDAATLQRLMAALREARLLKSDGHTAVDVDPVDLL